MPRALITGITGQDGSNAERVLGWRARVHLHELIRIMLEADLHQAGLDPAAYLGPVEASA